MRLVYEHVYVSFVYKPHPIMLKILPIMLFSSAQKLPIMLNIMLTNINNATVQV